METEVTLNVVCEDVSFDVSTSDSKDPDSFNNIEVINTNFIHGNV